MSKRQDQAKEAITEQTQEFVNAINLVKLTQEDREYLLTAFTKYLQNLEKFAKDMTELLEEDIKTKAAPVKFPDNETNEEV